MNCFFGEYDPVNFAVIRPSTISFLRIQAVVDTGDSGAVDIAAASAAAVRKIAGALLVAERETGEALLRQHRQRRRFREWCRLHRHVSLKAQHLALVKKLQGHYAYYGITTNFDAIARLFYEVPCLAEGTHPSIAVAALVVDDEPAVALPAPGAADRPSIRYVAMFSRRADAGNLHVRILGGLEKPAITRIKSLPARTGLRRSPATASALGDASRHLPPIPSAVGQVVFWRLAP
jgi:hypothetical protein